MSSNNNKVSAGTFTAKVIDYGMIENDAGEPVVIVRFNFDGGKTWAWTGGFGSEKAKERTLKTLITLGLSDDNLELLCDGPTSGVLNLQQEVEIVVTEEEYNGKIRTQISYVNPLGGRSFGEAFQKDKARAKLGGMNIKGDLAALGFKKKTSSSNLDSIPF